MKIDQFLPKMLVKMPYYYSKFNMKIVLKRFFFKETDLFPNLDEKLKIIKLIFSTFLQKKAI
jgi:hypothetical protein